MSNEQPGQQLDDATREHSRRLRRRVLVGTSIIAAIAAVVALTSGSAGAAPMIWRTTGSVPGCNTPMAGQPNGKQWPVEPAMSIDTTATYTATLETSCGRMTLALDAAKAPRTVNSFAFLANESYFDHTKCHRLTTEGIYVLQCGDPTGTGRGGPGYQFSDENLAGATYPAGTVAMANSGPNTNGSQFFLVYQDSRLPANYTPFGKISSGTEVLSNIAGGGVTDGSGDGAPVADVVLDLVSASRG
ncbi:peptidylprolyl isomerase [Nocardia sp. NPDC052566]|uniref:peptidylprolyl isomerase n=1 Tax=Nocardia sp. NPDC052566 TaxID=3364330 RepID=UPI0037CB7986